MRVLIALMVLTMGAFGQRDGPPGTLQVSADPSGACSLGALLQYNVLNGKLWGCKNNVYTEVSGGGGGSVSSVFTRTGDVVAVTGDYTAAQVTNAVDSSSTYSNPGWITALANSKITGLTAFATLATGATTTYVRGDASTQTLNIAALTDAATIVKGAAALSISGCLPYQASAGTITCVSGLTWDGTSINVPGGIKTTPAGGTAGALNITQGTAVSTIANSVTLTAPTSVTAYLLTFPSSISSGGFLKFNSSGVGSFDTGSYLSQTLTSAHVFVGNVSNVATDVAVSGDATMANTGAVSVVATHLSAPLPRAQGGLNSTSAGTGILRDGSTPAASELSGDATTSGSNVVTLPTINSNVGACGDATHTSQITLNAKGQATACTPVAISGVGGGNAAVANITAVTVSANTTSDQTLQELTLSSAVLNTVAAPFLIHGSGIFTIALAQTPALTFKAKLCTVSGCGSGTVVTLATITTTATVAATNNPWNINLKMATVSTGASGTVIVHGPLIIDTGATTATAEVVFNDVNTAASSAINLTGSLFIDFTVSTSAGNAGNSFTQQIATLEPASSQGAAGAAGAAGTLNFPINPQITTYQVLAGDFTSCKAITVASGTFTATLVASGSQPANGQCLWIVNYGSGVVTISRSGQNINGGTASLSLAAGSATAPTAAFILSDGTNYFASVMGGTAVTSVGGLTGVVPGGLILVEQHTASSSAELDFTTCISSTYDDYVIRGIAVAPATNAANLQIQYSTNSGSSYITTSSYQWGYWYVQAGAVSSGQVNSTGTDTSIHLTNANSNGSGASESFVYNLFAPGSGTTVTVLSDWTITQVNSGSAPTYYKESGLAEIVTAAAVNAFRVLYSSGNIASGTVRCYGVAKQ